MAEQERAEAPWHLWIVGVLTALWNTIGAFDFTATIARYEPYMAAFPAEAKEYWYSFPLWMFAIWGAAVWGGLLGSLLLLMRRKLAVALLGLSFACSVASMAISYVRPAPEGASDPVFALIIIAIAGALYFYAQHMNKKGVLG